MLDLVPLMFYCRRMDRDFAIERSRGRLVAVVLELFAEIGLTGVGVVERVSRPVYRKVQRVLRSAESAVRRLIIASARDIVVEPSCRRPAPAGPINSSQIKSKAEGEGNTKRKRGLLFRLFDRPRRKDWGIGRRRKTRKIEPRVRILDFDPRIPEFLRPQAPAPIPEKAHAIDDGTINAIRLCRRLFAIMGALEDIPRQARRYARWRDKPIDERRPRRESPFRLGWPPGWRIRPTHEVDEILKDCHWLVRNLEPQLDTS
jgi:hypothetical protein